MKIILLYQRRWFLIYLPLLLLLCAAVVTILWIWKPLPPQRVVIGTGPGQSSYLELARNYAARLENLGIQADIVARRIDAIVHASATPGRPGIVFCRHPRTTWRAVTPCPPSLRRCPPSPPAAVRSSPRPPMRR